MQAGPEVSRATCIWGMERPPDREMQMGMNRVGTACRTTSSDVKSSSRKASRYWPAQAEATLEESEMDCA